MMTAASIPAASAGTYADYLESRTVAPARGDYYLGTDGAPAEAPGRWLASAGSLHRLGIEGEGVDRDDLGALMEGRSPVDGGFIRPAGADGNRAGGLDVTFSAPKPVSVLWAIGNAAERAQIEEAHEIAVRGAVRYLRDTVPLLAGPGGANVTARELHAAEFRHTTARGVAGSVPDPQLHSHVVITSVERDDGEVAAVRSRPVFSAAREMGAFYRAQLADTLCSLGFVPYPTGKGGRYFGLVGVSDEVSKAFSKRTEEVRREAERFRAERGRDPERGELRNLSVRSRDAKLPTNRDELDASWRATAAQHGLHGLPAVDEAPINFEDWREGVLTHVTDGGATFDWRALRTTALEQAAGRGFGPGGALSMIDDMRDRGEILKLEDGLFTTARMRRVEERLEQHVRRLASDRLRVIDHGPVVDAIAVAEERLGARLTTEQIDAARTLTRPERAAVLVGQAGTGKGVVIDVAARAEWASGREVIGVAVAGRTAQRLGEDSPILAGKVSTIDGLIARAESGAGLNSKTTVYVDEAGMGDSVRLMRLAELIERDGASLVLIGDSRQLPSIGAGGMFERLAALAPVAELEEVHRVDDLDERGAWRELRAGDPAAAMAHYRARGDLHLTATRAEATDRAAHRYLDLAAEHGHGAVALMTDASNAEVDALNLRVQHLRAERDELGPALAENERGHSIHVGDRVTWTRSMEIRAAPRVENGVRGEAIGARGEEMLVRLDGSERVVALTDEAAESLRLAYAGHVYRQQGATVDRAVAVTGGWQTSREGAYVQASRARFGVEWHVPRDELEGEDDAERIDHLAARMRMEAAQPPSVAFDLDPSVAPDGPGLTPEPPIDLTP